MIAKEVKTNIGYILIVIILAVIVGGGSLWLSATQEGLAIQFVEVKKAERAKDKNTEWLDNQDKLYNLEPEKINSALEEIDRRWSDKKEKLRVISLLRLGTPYQLDPLGEESGKDKDPIFRLDVADCTTFVLTNVALLHSKNLKEAKETMKLINYRPGKEITFENRLHFTADRNITSPYFKDITELLAGKDKITSKKVILNKVNKGGQRLIDIDWEKEIILKYLPNRYLTEEFLNNLPGIIGVAFIKNENAEIGLDVSHEGILFDRKDLFHASQKKKKVIKENFIDYYFGEEGTSPKYDGIILYEI